MTSTNEKLSFTGNCSQKLPSNVAQIYMPVSRCKGLTSSHHMHALFVSLGLHGLCGEHGQSRLKPCETNKTPGVKTRDEQEQGSHVRSFETVETMDNYRIFLSRCAPDYKTGSCHVHGARGSTMYYVARIAEELCTLRGKCGSCK